MDTDKKTYASIITELKSLAMSLTDHPNEEQLRRFMDLENLADRHECEEDIRKGLTLIPIEIDEWLRFRIARRARSLGKTTNEYIITLLIKCLKANFV